MSNLQHNQMVTGEHLGPLIRSPVVTRVPGNAFVKFHDNQSNPRIPQFGDVALVEVLEVSDPKIAEHVPGEFIDCEHAPLTSLTQQRIAFSSTDLYPGHLMLAVVGTRYALDYLEGVVPSKPVKEMDLFTYSGVVGEVVSRNSLKQHSTRVRVLGYFRNADDDIVNTVDYGAKVSQEPFEMDGVKIIMITGGAMETGKTTSGSAITRALSLEPANHRVLAAKMTGCGTFRDPGSYSATGAERVLEYGAFGIPSTYTLEKDRVIGLFWQTCRLLLQEAGTSSDNRPITLVLEVSDGIGQRESWMLVSEPEIVNRVDHIVCAAADPLSADSGYRLLRRLGWGEKVVMAGRVGSHELAREEVRKLTGNNAIAFIDALPALNRNNPQTREIRGVFLG